MSDLFSNIEPWAPKLPDAKMRYFENFIPKEIADDYYNTLLENIPWQQDKINIFGKTHLQPRLTSLHSSNLKSYSYSGIRMLANPMSFELSAIKNLLEDVSEIDFNSVLINLYRNGRDSNGWHADNEKELGNDPVIASLSFGASRFFHLKHRTRKEAKLKFELKHGSLLLMEGGMQEYWLHQIAKTAREVKPRINLTYRKII
jgi:alkylated DNA repair dioxygenase AlkB